MNYDPAEALAALRQDARLASHFDRLGPYALEVRAQSPYLALTRAILYQQLSGKAAATIHGRLQALLGEGESDPAALLALPDDAIRAVGVSRNKVAALRDLATRTLAGGVPDRETLAALPDDEVVARLTQVRGVGRWTVEMLLMFNIGRPDVWPVDDLGVRKGVQLLLDLEEMPAPRAMHALGEPWRPYRSVVAWYCWRAVEAGR